MNLFRPSPGVNGAPPLAAAPLFYRWDVTRDEIAWVGNREAILGYAEHELPRSRQDWHSLVHPEDAGEIERLLASFLADRGAVCLKHRLRAKDDAWRHVADEAAFLGDDVVLGTVRLSPPEDPFRHYVEAAPVGVLAVADDGTIVFANHSAHASFGYAPGELVGLPVQTLVPVHLVQHNVHLGEADPEGAVPSLMAERELRGTRKDGSAVPVAVSLTPLAFGLACTIVDLTDLNRAERDMVKFFDLSLDPFCIASLDGYFLRVNANFSRILGYTDEELLSRPFLDFVHPDDQSATATESDRLAAGQPVLQFRNRYRDCRGEYHWFEWAARSTPDEGVTFAVARDVTERVQMERELVARDERERAILDNTTALVFVRGVDSRYQFVNRRFSELYRVERAATIGKTPHDLFPKEVADDFERNHQRVLETRETSSRQETIPHADGNHTYVSVRFPLFDGTGQVSAVAGISTDITDQLRAREADEQMRLARVFQQKLYPETAPSVPGLDVAGWALPISQVCGDYFDYVLRGGGRLAVTLGDVSGHGFGPALQMVEVRAIIRILLRASMPLENVVEELNRALCLDLPESSFVSLFLAEIDAARGEFRYVGAGHQALLFGADGGTTVLESTGPLLGILDIATFDCPPPIPIRPGDILVLFTDGLTEAMSVGGEQFGMRRLIETVERHRQEPSKVILQKLFEAVYDFARGRTLQDDMTAITVKVVG